MYFKFVSSREAAYYRGELIRDVGHLFLFEWNTILLIHEKQSIDPLKDLLVTTMFW